MTHSFANVLYLSISVLGNCLCFLLPSADFVQNQAFTNKPPGTTIRVLNSLDPDQDRHSGGLYLDSNCLQKAIGRRLNSPLACKEL